MRISNPDYRAIFEQRGAEYHEAMTRYPEARSREFGEIVSLARPRDGETVVDMPAGGGYLRRYLGPAVRLVAVETSTVFHARAAAMPDLETRLCALDSVPLESGSVDVIVSLAGLHHVADRPAVFAEMRRLLADDGRLCLADVEQGTGAAGFLNDFVDRHSTLGHAGDFIGDGFRRDLARAGLAIEQDRHVAYHWEFDVPETMVDYCRLLFGIDRAGPGEILEGIHRHLGHDRREALCRMGWSLTFIRCRKGESGEAGPRAGVV